MSFLIDPTILESWYAEENIQELQEWVRCCRDGMILEDATENHILRLLDFLQLGVWKPKDAWLDFKDPTTFRITSDFINRTLSRAEIKDPELIKLIHDFSEGRIKPRKSGRPKKASTAINTTIAYRCLSLMQSAGIPPYVSEGWEPPALGTGCQIVAQALGVSERSVTNWWQSFRKQQLRVFPETTPIKTPAKK